MPCTVEAMNTEIVIVSWLLSFVLLCLDVNLPNVSKTIKFMS